MTSTATYSAIDMMSDAGMSPADEVGPAWKNSYDAAIETGYGYLVAAAFNDRVWLARITPSCVVCDELYFDCPDDEASATTCAAFCAVVGAWA